MSTPVNRQVNIFISSGEAEAAYNRLKKKNDDFEAQLKKATDPATIKRLGQEIDKLKEPLDRAKKKMSGEVAPSIKELETLARNLGKTLRNTSTNDANFDKLLVQLRGVNVQLAEAKSRAASLQTAAAQGSGGLGGSIRNFAGNFLSGAASAFLPAAGIGTAVAFLQNATEEALAAEEATARFKTQLENLGKLDSFDRLSRQADALSESFQYLDNDDIIDQVFNKLLTYGKLTEAQITSLTPVIIDFAAKQKISLGESSDVIIKALEGNAKAVKTFGIDIKDASTESERFNLIMTELKGKVDGAAEAFGETTQGSIARTRQEFANLSENLGTQLLPAINAVMQGLSGMIEGLSSVGRVVLDIIDPNGKAFRKAEDIYKNSIDLAVDYATEAQKLFAQKNTEQLKAWLEDTNRILKTAAGQDKENQKALAEALTKEIGDRNDQVARQQKDKEKKLSEERQKAREKEVKEAEAAAKKIREDLLALRRELGEKGTELSLFNASQLDRDLARIETFYDKLRERARGNKELILQIEELEWQERNLIIGRWAKQVNETRLKEEAAAAEKSKKLEESRMQAALKAQQGIASQLAALADRNVGEAFAEKELAVITSRGKEKLAAQLEQLELQKQQEIAAAGDRQEQIKLIEEQYRQKENELRIQRTQEQISAYAEYANGIVSILDQVFNLQNQREQAQLASDRRVNDRKKENYKKQLDGKLISEQQYNKKVAELEKQQEEKERVAAIRQFNRDKAMSLSKAAISIAENIAKALANPFQVALVAALGAVQIATIAAQKPPQFKKGGLFDGPSHEEGGMPVYSRGRKVAELEGGEPILSRKTYANNKPLVDALLYNSMHRDGAPLASWQTAGASQLNVSRIRHSIGTVRRFDNGGVLGNGTEDRNVGGFSDEQFAILVQLLSRETRARVVLTEINDQNDRLSNIRKSATMR